MKQGPAEENRRYRRYGIHGQLALRILASGFSPGTDGPVQGTVHDISEGGLRILIAESVPVSTPVRCEIRLPGLPVPIPTLAQIQWVKTDPSGGGVLAGLQLLL